MEKFIEEKNEYLNSLKEQEKLILNYVNTTRRKDLVQILLYPKNEKELVRANSLLELIILLDRCTRW